MAFLTVAAGFQLKIAWDRAASSIPTPAYQSASRPFDDDGRQAADAVTGSCYRDGGIVHVANFDIVLGARQKLDQFHSLGAAGAAGGKDLDFSTLSHVSLSHVLTDTDTALEHAST